MKDTIGLNLHRPHREIVVRSEADGTLSREMNAEPGSAVFISVAGAENLCKKCDQIGPRA
ncbi:hypothetical protein [Methylorubrum sp. SB2]|uniref:hypothetical protein n=1 Tax=Methylorubrum subtropicum TaxID=3138812 RepID=UPI00313C64E2